MPDEAPRLAIQDDAELRRDRRRLSRFAWGMTAVWLASVTTYVLCGWSMLIHLEPNALGDFLAGATAPLAFFWLVVGYFQQGMELRQNSHALMMQADELRLQTAETKALVRESAKQAEAATKALEFELQRAQDARIAKISAALPRWVCIGNRSSDLGQTLELQNVGADASALQVRYGEDLGHVRLDNVGFVGRGAVVTASIVFNEHARPDLYEFALEYADARGQERSASVRVSREGDVNVSGITAFD
jgi:hypothetical protein